MHEGRCFCGDLKFDLSSDAKFSCHCHCESCRRAAGAGFVTWVTFPIDAFALTSGAMAERHSAPGVTRGHCALCGTSVSYTHENRPGYIDITAACLDDASIVVPFAHIWVEDKAPWVEINDELPQFQKTVTSED